MATTPAGRMLTRQLQQMQSDKDIPGISCGLVDNNIFEWEVMLMISDDVKLYGGCGHPYKVKRMLTYFDLRWLLPCSPSLPSRISSYAPEDEVRVSSVPPKYPTGTDVEKAPPRLSQRRCLHLYPASPEEDKYGYESAAERWSPVQTPETILLSVISMLSSPNDESAANVEAARLWREDPAEFKKRVRRCVRESLGED
ncbi:ubiquitin conjugating enzyme [Penicillium chermesinum]|nr:ubiquitin conjugating enzyme [Penicillium chermesinum]